MGARLRACIGFKYVVDYMQQQEIVMGGEESAASASSVICQSRCLLNALLLANVC